MRDSTLVSTTGCTDTTWKSLNTIPLAVQIIICIYDTVLILVIYVRDIVTTFKGPTMGVKRAKGT